VNTATEVEEAMRLEPWFRYARNWPDERQCEMVWLLAHSMLAIHDACLVGNPAPRVAAMYERMTHPQPGDVVLETGTCWRPDWPERALGRLIRIEPGANQFEDAYVVESMYYADGAITTWQNCHFIALPIDETNFLGRRERVVLTRESLVGALADAGIEVRR
jgi:hypothetical protein